MKPVCIFLCIALFSGCSALTTNGPRGADSAEQLLSLAQKYHTTNDVKNMLRLYKTEGVPGALVASKERWLTKVFGFGFKNITITPLPENARHIFNTPVTAAGQTVSYNVYIDSQLTANYKGNRQEGFLFGQDKEDGKYYFALQVSN